jgi:beta-phosphoglucomutase family hydrolase
MTVKPEENGCAVLWDMDGVLVDTGEFHYLTWKEMLELNGISFTRQDFQHTFGMNNGQVVTYVLGQSPDPELLKRMSDRKEENFREMVREQAQINTGVRRLLEQLQAAGVKQAIASSAPQENIDVVVDKFGIREFFGAMVSGDRLPSKPDPTVFRLAAQALGVSPGNCIVVEDAKAGVAAARWAGMKCIAVAATHPVDELDQADLVVQDLEDVSIDDFHRLFQNESLEEKC